MANTFKLKTKANISTSNFESVYAVPPTVDSAIVLGLILSNKANASISASVNLNTNTSDNTEVNENVTLLHNITVPEGSTLEMFAGQKLVLQKYDSLLVKCDAENSLDVALSILEVD